MTQDIAFSCERHIGLITLQRTYALNALTLPMIIALQQQLEAWEKDNHIHAVVIQAVPGKAFCAGGDVRWLYDAGKHSDPKQMQFFWHEYRLNHFIHRFKKPYIAFMDGVTMGGGVGISLHGSHPVASERFVFAMPETGIGFFPDIGAAYLLSRCPGYYGEYLGLTGYRLGASDAQALGLVKQVMSSERMPAAIERLMETDLSKEADTRVDACLQEFVMPATIAPIMNIASSVDDVFCLKDVEAMIARLDQVNDSWHRETGSELKKKSPFGLKVTLEHIKKSRSLSMADCIKMDYCLVGHFMRGHDFYEGVRALLIDKDQSPKWQPASLSFVTSSSVADYFECGQKELSLLGCNHV
jgi:enoyl-CoA hydratase